MDDWTRKRLKEVETSAKQQAAELPRKKKREHPEDGFVKIQRGRFNFYGQRLDPPPAPPAPPPEA